MAANEALSSAQFFQSIAKRTLEEGGVTVNVNTGHEPSTGWMVSAADREHRIPAKAYSGRKVADYVHRHEKELARPGKHLGTWRDSRETSQGEPLRQPLDTVYSDVSEAYPNATTAQAALIRNGQIAAYHLDKGKTWTADELARGLADTEPDPRAGR